LADDPDLQVTLVTWVQGEAPEHLAMTQSIVDEFVALPLEPAGMSASRRALRHLRFVAGGPPTYVQLMADERRLSVREIAPRAGSFDVVVLEEEALADMGLPDLGAPVVLHRLNVFERVLADVPEPNLLKRTIARLERPGWRRFDRRVSGLADRVIATTPESAALLRPMAPDVPVEVVTNGVELPELPVRPSDGVDVAFIGWMSYPANVDAARWFVAEIWPKVRAQAEWSRCRIIGREPSPRVTMLAGPDVVVTGEVADVVASCVGVRVGIAPLRGGMGIKNKTLEYLAMGLPVVATPAGVEGLPRPLGGVVEAADEAGFAEAVLRLLRCPAEADALGAAGRSYVGTHFSWPSIGHRYAALLRGSGEAGRWRVVGA
jgi:glycosyltransferase involved in cell wall biosynthesis